MLLGKLNIMAFMLLSSIMCSGAANVNFDKLWKDYESARKADRPKQQIEILERIGDAARTSHSAWNFHRYWQENINVQTSRNWKLHDSLQNERIRAVKAFDEPILTYFDGDGAFYEKQLEFIRDNEKRLRKALNKDFYSRYLSQKNIKCVTNDYEFLVWINRGRDKELFKKVLLERYSPSAVALFSEQDSLKKIYEDLDMSRNVSTEKQYKELYDACLDFEKRRQSFKGADGDLAACLDEVAGIIDGLTRKDIRFSIAGRTLTAVLRNVPYFDVSVSGGAKVRVKNPANRFYVEDTVKYELPDLADGTYKVSCKYVANQECDYVKHTISLAQRHDAKGFSVYAADFDTGRPLDDAEIALYRDDKVIDSVKCSFSKGYAYLPDDFLDNINLKKIFSYRLECRAKDTRGRIRLSDRISLTQSSPENPGTYIGSSAVYPDRTVCKQGDTVRYKVVVYDVDAKYCAAVASGREITVSLMDPQRKVVSKSVLRTNEFGSAAGSFAIPAGGRNGMWTICCKSGDSGCSSSAYIRVDEVVLPTYELVFDEDNVHTALPGEKIKVSGILRGYSGHNPSSAKVSYRVMNNGSDILREGTVKLDNTGRFVVEFNATDRQYDCYNIEVNVTDLTGETYGFNTSRQSSGELDLSVTLANAAQGELNQGSVDSPLRRNSTRILAGDIAEFDFHSRFEETEVSYNIRRDGQIVRSGKTTSNGHVQVDMSGLPQGIYSIDAISSKIGHKAKTFLRIFKMSGEDTCINADVEHLFLPMDGPQPAFRIGTTTAPMWVCVALYGQGNVLLDSRLVYLDGRKGTAGSLQDIRFDADIPQGRAVTAYAFYFRSGESYCWEHRFEAPQRGSSLPLQFERVRSQASPASRYLFVLGCRTGAEAVASVYDKAMETFQSNIYHGITLPSPSAPYISHNSAAAKGGASRSMVYGTKSMRMAAKTANASMMAVGDDVVDSSLALDIMDYRAEIVEEEAMAAPASGVQAPAVRRDFSTVLAFEPFVRSDADGKLSFEVSTSDKLSTFIVQVFAHDREMNNGVASTEMVVSVPVEVSVVEPRFLYEGDRYVLKAKFSNSLERVVNGTAKVELYAGDDYQTAPQIGSDSIAMALQAREDKDFEYEIPVPEGTGTLGIKVSYIAEPSSEDEICGSDAVFVKVPVSPAHQEISESHSAVLLSGADRDALIASLRAMFVNGPGDSAEVREISIYDMLLEAMPKSVDTTAHNAETLSGSIMVARALSDMGVDDPSVDALSARLRECRNTDGGFGWFPSMSSSPVITAVVLERLAGNPDWAEELRSAVEYLDRSMFRNYKSKIWWGGISLSQYLYVRSMYPEVGFDVKDSADGKELREFRKRVRAYLTPGSDRGLQGAVAAKTRRALTLRRLSADDAGNGLAKALGVRIASQKRLTKSEAKDIASLREYAVEHPSGGAYFPNAFMPWRGLLEGELYEHTLLHRLLGDDRICLWMMLQKETQQWGNDPAYVDALMETLSASQETLDTNVIALNARWTKPFSQVEPAGNGMSVSRTWFREEAVGDTTVRNVELKDGDMLNVGDKITVRYNIWNEENRSFVRLKAFRPANLLPVEQLSGPMGWYPWLFRALNCPTPQGYRNVLPDATEYWYDVYPEEKTAVSEQFYVTQKGCFQSPAVIIESLYAPHYRANDRPVSISSDNK